MLGPAVQHVVLFSYMFYFMLLAESYVGQNHQFKRESSYVPSVASES